MNLRERLQVRALVNLIISVIERLAALFEKYGPKSPSKRDDEPVPSKPDKRRPLKKVVDTIDNIIPLPWRK